MDNLAEFDVSKLVQAINVRKSCRSFMYDKVDKTLLEKVNSEFNAIELPFDNEIKIVEYDTIPTKGLYVSFSAPPKGVAFIGKTDVISQSKAGFIGELYVLTATANGLGTCWIGHFKNTELNYLMANAKKEPCADMTQTYGFANGIGGEVAMCITPIGKPNKSTILSKVFGLLGSSRKQLIDLMALNSPRKIFSQEINNILELARLAPSALNGQYWRFNVSQDEKLITVSSDIGASNFKWSHLNIDIGICAAHIWLGLLHYGYNFTVNITEDCGRAVWEFVLDKFGKNYKTESFDFD